MRKQLLSAICCILVTSSLHCLASIGKLTLNQPSLTPTAPILPAKSYLLLDADTGTILAEKNSDLSLPPASLTKLMTLYLTFQALHNGQIKETDLVHISKNAWRMKGSRMFLKADTNVSVKKIITGIVVASGNDASVAIAEYLAGSESAFVKIMNQTAHNMGLTQTHFADSTGLPKKNHHASTADLAKLTRAIIIHFPSYYHYFSEKWIDYNHIKQPNRNRLLWRDLNVDGLKTGHTDGAGYCLISSAKQGNMRLISIIMGAKSDTARANLSQRLLRYGFRFYAGKKLFPANQSITSQKLWLGKKKSINFGLMHPLHVTFPKNKYAELKANITLPVDLKAPIEKGKAYGAVNVTLAGKTITSVPLIALESSQLASPISRFFSKIKLKLSHIF